MPRGTSQTILQLQAKPYKQIISLCFEKQIGRKFVKSWATKKFLHEAFRKHDAHDRRCLKKESRKEAAKAAKKADGERARAEKSKKLAEEGVPDLADVEPKYIECKGWKTSLKGINEFDELPLEAKNFIKKIEEVCEIPIDIISTGPDDQGTIVVNKEI